MLVLASASSAYASLHIAPGVTISNSQGSVSFPQGAYVDSRTNAANYMIFTVSNSLSSNPSSTINITITPVANTQMQIGFVDTVVNYPQQRLAVIAGNVTSSTWVSANSTLVVYSLTTENSILIAYQNQVTLPLNAGWNLVSLPVVPNNNDIRSILGTLLSKVTIVWSYTGSPRSWQSFHPPASGTLRTMVDGSGYWIYLTASATLLVEGSIIPTASLPPSYQLLSGWNLVGFKPQPNIQNEMVTTFLSSITGGYDMNAVWVYDNSHASWIRATSAYMLQPGQAIWILMTAPAVLRP